MEDNIKLTILTGSTRTGSISKMFARHAADIATFNGAHVTFIDLRDYHIPLYDGDDEAKNGMPVRAKELKKIIYDSDALIICSPEYNRAVSGVLKNAIDWLSRKSSPEDPNKCFEDRPIFLMASSPGNYGGIFALYNLRQILGHLKALIMGDQMPLPMAGEAFDENGKLKDDKKRLQLESYVKKLIETTQKFKR